MRNFQLFLSLLKERNKELDPRFLLIKGNRHYVSLGFLSSVVIADDPLEPLVTLLPKYPTSGHPLIYLGTQKNHQAYRISGDVFPSSLDTRRHMAWKTWVSVPFAMVVLTVRSQAYATYKYELKRDGIAEIPPFAEKLGLSLIKDLGVGYVMKSTVNGFLIIDGNRIVIPSDETYELYVESGCDEYEFDLRDGTWIKYMYAQKRRVNPRHSYAA